MVVGDDTSAGPGVAVRGAGSAGAHVNYLSRLNLECFLGWQEKYRRCYVEADPWQMPVRLMFDRSLERKRLAARAWLNEKSSRWRKRVPANEVVPIVLGWGTAPRAIWTARNAGKRRNK